MTETQYSSPVKKEISLSERESKFQKLSEKYGLHQGVEVTLKKIHINKENNSDVKPGTELKGIISNAIGIDRSIILYKNGEFNG